MSTRALQSLASGSPILPALLRAGIGLMLASLGIEANAIWKCTDEWGRSYWVEHEFGAGIAGIVCKQVDQAPAVSSAPPAASLQRSASASAREALALYPATGRGRLALLPPAAPGIGTLAAINLERMQPFDALIDTAARRHGHDANLLRAIIQVESGFDAHAVSPKGAIGLMQVMPTTAERLGVPDARRSLFEPETNIRAGASYLGILKTMFGTRIDLVIAAYNAGEGAVLRYNRSVPPFPETQAYVRKVMATYSGLRGAQGK